MTAPEHWLVAVRGVLTAIADSDVVEVRYRGPRWRLRLHRQPRTARQPAAAVPAALDRTPLHALCAPLTGVFYAASSPQAPPYVSEGDSVEPGRIVGLIETMKIFNEVVADVRGRIVEITVVPGVLVHQGEVLMRLDVQSAALDDGEASPASGRAAPTPGAPPDPAGSAPAHGERA